MVLILLSHRVTLSHSWFVVELKQILIFSGEFLSLPLHFRAVIIMSDIENGKGGGSFYSVQDREGGGWVG